MEEIDRIAPPVPPLPSPVGRNVGSKRQQTPRDGGRQKQDSEPPESDPKPSNPSEHIDEYV
jgi:hypothetical protein